MSSAREKRLLLGLLALLAPLPLPFNRVISWPVLGLFLVLTCLFLMRAARDEGGWLPLWAMNLLGLIYLPLFLVDLAGSLRGSVLRPLVHLALFTLVIKLMGMRKENEKWHALVLIFFLFLAAMGSSVHPTVVVFLAAFLALSLYVLARFAALHMTSARSLAAGGETRVPLRGFVVVATLLALLGAVPLFVLLPRIKTPYLTAPVGGAGELVQGSGFGDRIGLDSVGNARGSPAVAMRVRYEGSPPPAHEMRFKAGVYDRYGEGSWLREAAAGRRLQPGPGGLIALSPGVSRGWAEVWRRPDGTRYLPIPIDAVSLEISARGLLISPAGVIKQPVPPRATLTYRVGLGPEAMIPGPEAPLPAGSALLDNGGVGPDVVRLAAQVMGSGTAAQRAARLESHLASEYEYSLEFLGRGTGSPVEDFLLRWRRGHCEYFASAMVLMLRSQGVPARLVTGFLGGDYNPLEGYFIVRYAHAHAWVEALVDGEGWRTYDPTPPAGRPLSTREGLTAALGRAWDLLVFRWDRYVLSFGFYDQVEFLIELRGRLRGLWQGLWRQTGEQAPSVQPPEALGPEPAPAPGESGPAPAAMGALALLLVLLLASWLWRHRPPLTASRAFRLLRRRAARVGPEWPDSLPPLAAVERLGRSFPAAAAPSRRLVELYLRESFGEELLGSEDLNELKPLLRAAAGSIRKAG